MSSLGRFALAAIPVLMMLAFLPWVNRIEPRILGVPFLLAWLLFWTLLTPAFMFAADRMRTE